MKNRIFQRGRINAAMIIALSCAHSLCAQVVDTGDKVGIGVNPPLEKLHINGAVRGGGYGGSLRISTGSGTVEIGPMNTTWSHFQTDRSKFYFNKPVTVDGGISSYNLNNLFLQTNDATRLTILNSNGNIGIGLTAPEGKLHVRGCAYFGNENENSWHRVAVGGSGGDYGSIGYGYKYSTISMQHTYSVADYASQLSFDVGGFTFKTAPVGSGGSTVTFTNAMRILQNGNVGIGTNSIDSKLTVNGRIKAEEVSVVVDVPADYVFSEDYALTTLNEVEKFINKNNHLPGMPSAAEIKENGWTVGAMSNKMLEKIEELTLYIIEMKKENENLKEDNMELKTRITAIEQSLSRN